MNGFDKQSDLELIERVKSGEKEVFGEIVRRHRQIIASTVYGMLGDCQEADDTGQETFIRFYKFIGNFKGESALSTYLVRIAINLSLNELKRRKRKDSLFVFKEEDRLADVGDEDSAVDDQITAENIDAALNRLDENFRQVVVLRLIEGYSVKETAEILELPIGTVLSRLSRAQKKLQKLLTVNEKIKVE